MHNSSSTISYKGCILPTEMVLHLFIKNWLSVLACVCVCVCVCARALGCFSHVQFMYKFISGSSILFHYSVHPSAKITLFWLFLCITSWEILLFDFLFFPSCICLVCVSGQPWFYTVSCKMEMFATLLFSDIDSVFAVNFYNILAHGK